MITKIRVKALYSLPKSEHTGEDNDDFILTGASGNEYAVSDGATVSIFSREWARVLCEHFCASPVNRITPEWIASASEKLDDMVQGTSMNRFAELNFKEQGSHATLLGLRFDFEEKKFFVTSIGDTCIYFRNSALGKMLPLDRPEMFNNYPHFLCSITDKNMESLANQINYSGRLLEGKNRFYVMTDALAKWFARNLARERESRKKPNEVKRENSLKESLYKPLKLTRSLFEGNEPWKRLDRILNEGSFGRFVRNLRRKNQIDDDDTSLLILEVLVGDK